MFPTNYNYIQPPATPTTVNGKLTRETIVAVTVASICGYILIGLSILLFPSLKRPKWLAQSRLQRSDYVLWAIWLLGLVTMWPIFLPMIWIVDKIVKGREGLEKMARMRRHERLEKKDGLGRQEVVVAVPTLPGPGDRGRSKMRVERDVEMGDVPLDVIVEEDEEEEAMGGRTPDGGRFMIEGL